MNRRERLRARRLPPTPVTIRTDFSDAADTAFAEVGAASQAVLDAHQSGVPAQAAQQRLDAAQEATAEFVETLQVHPIPPHEYEDLIAAHPPSEKERKEGAAWDYTTLCPAMLAACVDRDTADQMSSEDWTADIKAGVYATGEVATLFRTCLTVNDRSRDVRVGKG